MAFETKEEVLQKILDKKRQPVCPHCQEEMKLWEVPPVNFGDGLGWGTPYLFVCFNDNCSLYTGGWDHMKENYAHTASFRCICYPDSESFEVMPVFSPMGGQGQLIEEQALAEEEALKENIKIGFNILAECYVSKDSESVVRLLTDVTQPVRVRIKAGEMIGDIGGLEVLDLLQSLKFGNQKLQDEVAGAISKIHERHFTRECPFCAETIKKRANICKHCNREVAGL